MNLVTSYELGVTRIMYVLIIMPITTFDVYE